MAVLIIVAVILVLGVGALLVYNSAQRRGRILIKPSSSEVAQRQARQRAADSARPTSGEGERQ